MIGELDARDSYVALDWALQQVRKYSPEFARGQLERNYLHTLEQLLAAIQREARA